MELIATFLSGLGLFFVGIRALSANLVPLIGRRARTLFALTLAGPASAAASGAVAGLLTQSSNAVSWILLGFQRAGALPKGAALTAAAWSNVGTAMLPLLVAFDTGLVAKIVIGLVGLAIYFKLAEGGQRRHSLEALLALSFVLLGLDIVSGTIGEIRSDLQGQPALAIVLHAPLLLALIGAAFSFAAQSSTVTTAVAVAAIGSGLLTPEAALPLIAGANAGAIFNNALAIPQEVGESRLIFLFQVVQKSVGTLFLAAFAVLAARSPLPHAALVAVAGHSVGTQIAILFAIAQIIGAFFTTLTRLPVTRAFLRFARPDPTETLGHPVFLMREAIKDPPIAIDLSQREIARLCERLPLILNYVLDEPEEGQPPAELLRSAGVTLARSIQTYLREVLDRRPQREALSTILLLEDAANHAADLHTALAELAGAVPAAASIPTTGHLVEALHTLMTVTANHAETLGRDDPDIALDLLGHRDRLMEELRMRLAANPDAPAAVQDALFRITILFERAVWLARRLVTDLSQAQRTIEAS